MSISPNCVPGSVSTNSAMGRSSLQAGTPKAPPAAAAAASGGKAARSGGGGGANPGIGFGARENYCGHGFFSKGSPSKVVDVILI